MRILWVLPLFLALSSTSYAYSEPSDKQKRIIAGFIKQQAKNNIHVGKSISTILKRYPERADIILPIAFELYPSKSEQIVKSAIEAEPALACDVVIAAIDNNMLTTEQVIRIAIDADPAYANEIIETVAQRSEDKLEDIVRIAITTEPVMGHYVTKGAMKSFPEQMLDVLSGAIKAIPDQVTNFMQEALLLFPGKADTVIETTISHNSTVATQQIIDAAVESGINENAAINAAIAGGAKQSEIAKSDHN